MTEKMKRQLVIVLLVLAALLVPVAIATWNVGEGRDPNPYREAFGLPPDPPKRESNHALSFVLLAASGVAVISAAILGASMKPQQRDDSESA